MYLRHSTRKKNGKRHTYWALVKSVRNGRKVRQQVVAYLGELDEQARIKAKSFAKILTGRKAPGQLEFWEEAPSEPVSVFMDQIRLTRSRRFGDVWMAFVLWQALLFDRFFEKHLPTGQEDVPWSNIIATLVLARLCQPSSELRIAEYWFRSTALDDLLDIPDDKINDDRLYRGLDKLLPLKNEIEKHVRNRLGELFELDYEILLYDVTSTYFEGEASKNPMAQRGYSRDQRPDCKQMNIGLVATRDGMPLGYEVFSGNTHDVNTIIEVVEKIEAKFGRSQRVWILDRGMVSEDVLEWLREENRNYIVGTPKAWLKRYEQELVEKDGWETIREDVEVKTCPSPDGQETFILCRSAARKEKEEAMHDKFYVKIEEGLQSLKRRLERQQKEEHIGRVERQIGRLLQRNQRAAKLFNIKVISSSVNLCGVEISWSCNQEHQAWAKLSEGCYLLRAHGIEWTPDELWRAYIQLTDVEEAFRIHKTELRIRPVYHQTSERAQAHILVCFIAYVLWKTLEQWSLRLRWGVVQKRYYRSYLSSTAQILFCQQVADKT